MMLEMMVPCRTRTPATTAPFLRAALRGRARGYGPALSSHPAQPQPSRRDQDYFNSLEAITEMAKGGDKDANYARNLLDQKEYQEEEIQNLKKTLEYWHQ